MTPVYFDIECYQNYFLVLFMNAMGGFRAFEMHEGQRLNVAGILGVLSTPDVEFVTFNGNNYDMPMLAYALAGATNGQLKQLSDQIIVANLKPWAVYRQFGIPEVTVNHVDLIDVAPGMVGLKLYGGRLHSKRLQDLPYSPGAELTPSQMVEVKKYCGNDLHLTKNLHRNLHQQIELRRVMSGHYGLDLRSKSDAQIAEAVLKAEYTRLTGYEPSKTTTTSRTFRYTAPTNIGFTSELLLSAMNTICASDMVVMDTGHVKMPKDIEKMALTIGGTTYKVGVGGLHSQETEITRKAGDGYKLYDIDVVSYYPNLMLNMGMEVAALAPHFQSIYRKVLSERIEAKKAKNKTTADSLKIVLNSTFGKTSNKYSMLYNPEMMIRVTLSGQLYLLMLIESLEKRGIPVVSANTDGIVVMCADTREVELRRVVSCWEKHCHLETEWSEYLALHSRDVNSYVAIRTDGEVKLKGAFKLADISKNPQNEICTEAVIAYLKDGTPVETTVHACTDIKKFVTVRTVNGGALKDGKLVGKVVRWYYARGESGTMHYATTGNTVPRSKGAMPLQELPDIIPSNVDYDWYINECNSLLMDVGVIERPVVPKLPRKNSAAWKTLLAEGKITENDEGVWTWAM